MPVTVRSTGGGRYSVSTPNGVKAKGTTKEKAEAQARLLEELDNAVSPRKTPRPRSMRG